jgi:adenylate cyclase
MPSVRRLTAILAADVAGYSRLMGADEAILHDPVKLHFSETILMRCMEAKSRIGAPS